MEGFYPGYPLLSLFGRYETIDQYAPFISTRNLRENLKSIQTFDLDACKAEMAEKMALLEWPLIHCNARTAEKYICHSGQSAAAGGPTDRMEPSECEGHGAPTERAD